MLNKKLAELDRIFDSLLPRENSYNYPPFNILKLNDDEYLLEMAVAGYDPNDIQVYVEDGCLIIEANSKIDHPEIDTIYRGISQKKFKRSYKLVKSEVKEVKYLNGILSIRIGVIIPPSNKQYFAISQ